MKQAQSSNRLLSGRTAVVTGASRGIGRSIALALAGQGANLAIVSRRSEPLKAVEQELESLGTEVFACSFDVRQSDALASFLAQTKQHLGAPTILINNAGIYATHPLLDHTLEDWRKIMDINLTAAMWATRNLLPDMIAARQGRIINISSISGKSGEPYGAAYSASKFAMIGLTQSVALEVARFGVTVNAVCPGWVDTEMAREQLTDPKWCELNALEVEESQEIARLSMPQQRFVQPQEVAALVRFLCLDEAQSITGQAINICGGLSLH